MSRYFFLLFVLVLYFFAQNSYALTTGDYDPDYSCYQFEYFGNSQSASAWVNSSTPSCQALIDSFNQSDLTYPDHFVLDSSTPVGDPISRYYCTYHSVIYSDSQLSCTAPETLDYSDCTCKEECNVPDGSNTQLTDITTASACTAENVNARSVGTYPYVWTNVTWVDCKPGCFATRVDCPEGQTNAQGTCVEPRPKTDECNNWNFVDQTASLLGESYCYDTYQCMQYDSPLYGTQTQFTVVCGGDRSDSGGSDDSDDTQNGDTNSTDDIKDETSDDRYCSTIFVSYNPDVCKEECFSDESHFNLVSTKTVSCIYDQDNNGTLDSNSSSVDLTPVTSRQDQMLDKMNDQISRLDTLVSNTNEIHGDLEELKTIQNGIADDTQQIKENTQATVDKLAYLIQNNAAGFDDVVAAINGLGTGGYDDTELRGDLEGIRQAIEDKNLSVDLSKLEELLKGDEPDDNLSDGSAGFGQYSEDVKSSFDQFKLGDVLGISSAATSVELEDVSFYFMDYSITIPLHKFWVMIDVDVVRGILMFIAVILGFRDVMRGS